MRWAVSERYENGNRMRWHSDTNRKKVVYHLRRMRAAYPNCRYVLVRLVKPSEKLQRELDALLEALGVEDSHEALRLAKWLRSDAAGVTAALDAAGISSEEVTHGREEMTHAPMTWRRPRRSPERVTMLMTQCSNAQREALRLHMELDAAKKALGAVWLNDGASLAEGIHRKTAALEG